MNRFLPLGIDFPFFIAPMVGITHVAFRELVRHYTPPSLKPRLFTEMLSSRRLPGQHLDQVHCLRTSTGESGLIPQLLCNDEQAIAASVEKLERLFPSGLDINMGCPASQTLKYNWGVQLMHDPGYAARVVGYAKKVSPWPVSVKLRAAIGSRFNQEYLLDFTRHLEDAGADWLTIHCRTQAQSHHGYAHWESVEAVVQERQIPIVLNGDIQTWQDALAARKTTGAAGVMIARAAIARPWILWQIAKQLGVADAPTHAARENPPWTPEEEGEEWFCALTRFCCLLEEYFGNTEESLRKGLFFLSYASRWLLFGHPFMTGAKKCRDLYALRDYLNAYRDQHPQRLIQQARA